MKTHLPLGRFFLPFTLLFFFSGILLAQNVGVGTNTPNASAKLDIVDANRGLLIPRVALTNVTVAAPVTAPATGLLVYNTTAAVTGGNGPGFYYWDGGQWQMLSPASATSTDWALLGNAGTTPGTNFVGTTDNQALAVRTNNTEAMRVQTNQNVSIGLTGNFARLHVDIPSGNTTENQGLYNRHDGTYTGATYAMQNYNNSATNSTKYGLYNYVNSEGTGAHYGIYNYTYQNSASNSTVIGMRNYVNAYGTGGHYGGYNYLNLSGTAVSNINYASYNLLNVSSSANTSTLYGEYTQMDYSSGDRYGEYKNLNSNSTYDGVVYGDYNRLYGTGDGQNYGSYNDMDATGTGSKYAVYNDFDEDAGAVVYGMYNDLKTSSTKYGVRNEFDDVGGTKYGTYNYQPNGTNTGTIYGTYNSFNNDGGSAKYGTRNYFAVNDGTIYGTYNFVSIPTGHNDNVYGNYTYVGSAGTGTHYGIYANIPGGSNDYAAMFYAGHVVINEIGNAEYDLRVETDTRTHALFVDAGNDVVRIGDDFGSLSGNGSSIVGTTVDYVADFDNGGVDGTAIGIGSIEYLLDGSARTTINNEFDPTAHLIYDLGNSTTAEAWDDVYADNFVNVSDAREKNDITDLGYGLKEVLGMRPVSYTLKRDPFGETKLGLIAQEVLPLVSEAVKTHDHKITDESKPTEFEKVELERMGMKYNQLIPVLIKAVQEQQEQIEDLKSEIEQLKAEK